MIKVYTDGGCDLDKSLVEEYGITELPLTITIDDKEYLSGELTTEQFYTAMAAAKDLPKTSQVTPRVFKEEFKKELEQGNEIIYISLSSGLSGTYGASMVAAEELGNDRISIVDSLSASGGQGMIALEAARMAKEGMAREEIVKIADKMAKYVESIFFVDDIEYLKKGGRLSDSKAFVAKLLNIKPVLQVEKTGRIVSLDKARSTKQALQKLISVMKERFNNTEYPCVHIATAMAKETREELKSMIIAAFPQVTEVVLSDMGAVIGSHVGPGSVAVFFFNNVEKTLEAKG